MKKALLFLLILTAVIFTSCVPSQDLIYLQKKNDSESTPSVNPVMAKPYRVQTNDILSIKIKALDAKLVEMFNASETNLNAQSEQSLYFNGYSVDDHGNIRIPVLGEVNVLGFTLEEIRIKIEKQLLDEYFNKEANIFVNVKLAGLRYTVNGEIASPGTKTLFQEKVNVLEAIANSGDITMVGNRKEVTIIRQYPHGTEMHTLDLTDRNVMNSPYYYIQPNDYIYIKPLKQKSWGTGTTGIQSLGTIITLISLVTTTIVLLNR
ncbi:polysaccharide export outer membrane protein [Flavobacterium gossypii]|jgi:Periplasmic protein involved in polysaccharide export|uniref:Polysaccharide export outer membrane protein n=2 Tax=Flavobacterium TaxID=237 RepID=A0A495M989_9FLAO|nr:MULTISPECIES: polysaccharide biosynthesis/export family protein [Flavobacterium]MBA9074653.1 polysaccharide export outer membrane protein [Flavobacterium gossypii]RKS21855.1 polysaccharide export outer membrane protein [Flavobacterium endophyticum]WDO14448.1 polysaccharide biosynthesis/export family protein [Flavobacterium sp. WW92]